MPNVFHPGERAIQEQTGETHLADAIQGLIMPAIPHGAINFIEKQTMVIIGTSNAAGELWASLVIGQPGFVKVPDPATVLFDTRRITSNPADVFLANLHDNDQVGCLFIELASRKRMRVNGTAQLEGALIRLSIGQAYPNCPKYIQRRVMTPPEYDEPVQATTLTGTSLQPEAIDWISQADTLFVASAGTAGGVDASHRGGNPGFVQVLDHQVLKIPDYPGNSLFNTLGNIVQHPQVGLLFVDFDRRHTLQLTGTASLLFDQTSEADLLRTKGTGRYWLFHPQHWMHTIGHHHLQWTFLQYSPYNPPGPVV